jgi:hypothetical protein
METLQCRSERVRDADGIAGRRIMFVMQSMIEGHMSRIFDAENNAGRPVLADRRSDNSADRQ